MAHAVFGLCENMLMQIDANEVVLYMQISHATTLWLLFQGDKRTLVSVCLLMLVSICLCLGACLGCLSENDGFHKATNAINTPSPINLNVHAGFTG